MPSFIEIHPLSDEKTCHVEYVLTDGRTAHGQTDRRQIRKHKPLAATVGGERL